MKVFEIYCSVEDIRDHDGHAQEESAAKHYGIFEKEPLLLRHIEILIGNKIHGQHDGHLLGKQSDDPCHYRD